MASLLSDSEHVSDQFPSTDKLQQQLDHETGTSNCDATKQST